MNFESKTAKYYWYFSVLIVSLIILLGIFLFISDFFKNVPTNIRIVIATFIISYGSFRLVMIFSKLKKRNDENENNSND
jgi:hypothetical protein